jgi:[acyl-carrier-protein] S-malonyltransferase
VRFEVRGSRFEVRVAFLFPGQGSRGVLDALSLANESERGRALLALAAHEAGVELTALTAEEGRALERTEVLQPALVAACLALSERLTDAGLAPQLAAGHSLGELCAWAAAGPFSAEDTVVLAAERGRLMGREAARRAGGLLALSEVDTAGVQAALALGAQHGRVTVGALNAPDEVVLTGDDAALNAVSRRFPSRRLEVVGAWHSEAMAAAVDDFARTLSAMRAAAPRFDVIPNFDGRPRHGAAELTALLSSQLTHPVQWQATLSALPERGVTDVVTVGPGAALRALLRRNPPTAGVRVHGAGEARELERTLRHFRETA